jgi:hypothetical protein
MIHKTDLWASTNGMIVESTSTPTSAAYLKCSKCKLEIKTSTIVWVDGSPVCLGCLEDKYNKLTIIGATECPCCGAKIKPCPFCGKPGQIYGCNNVGCSEFECGANVDFGHWCGIGDDGKPAVHWVIENWNKRI